MRTSPHPRALGLPLFAAALLAGCAEKADRPVATAPEPKPAVASRPAPKPAGRVTRIALTDFFPLQQSGAVLIYDVRPGFYHTLGNIPGSVNWPKSAFNEQLAIREGEIRAATAAGRPVVVYCTDLACPDARDVATWLAARGHHIRVLEGGWEAWKAIGFSEN